MPTARPNPALPRKPAIPTAELLTLLAEADFCFTEVAQRCSINVEELSLYLMTDEGRDLFMAAQSAAMMRVRFAATSKLNHAVSALSLMLMTYQTESETLFRDSPPTRKFREIQRVNARRAASLLTRLANLQYRPLIAAQNLSPREGFGAEAAGTTAPNHPNPTTSTCLGSASLREGFGVGESHTTAPIKPSPQAAAHVQIPSLRQGPGPRAAISAAPARSTPARPAISLPAFNHQPSTRIPEQTPACRSP